MHDAEDCPVLCVCVYIYIYLRACKRVFLCVCPADAGLSTSALAITALQYFLSSRLWTDTEPPNTQLAHRQLLNPSATLKSHLFITPIYYTPSLWRRMPLHTKFVCVPVLVLVLVKISWSLSCSLSALFLSNCSCLFRSFSCKNTHKPSQGFTF